MFRSLRKMLGPGLVTGASDDDPSGIATYTQAGAAFGLGLLWAAFLTLPLMVAVQEASARLSLVTRRGLIRNLTTRVPRPVIWIGVFLFVCVNAFNVGADLQMMSASAAMLTGFPVWLWLIGFVILVLVLQIFLNYPQEARVLKWLCLSLFAYVLVAFAVRVDWMAAAYATLVPQFAPTKDYWLMLVALLGTTLSPYLLVWESAQEVEEDRNDDEKTDEILFRRRSDVAVGMTFSNLIAWFVILTAASVLFANGLRDVTTPAEAAAVLAPIAGPYASWLFSFGVIGIGLLAVPVLSSSAAYAVAEAAGWKRTGLSRTWKQAPAFYLVVIGVTLAGVASASLGLNPIRALIYAAVGNALIAPLLLLALIRLTGDRHLMGRHVNGRLSSVLLWAAFLAMSAALVFWVVFH